jgi:hypothetical protein
MALLLAIQIADLERHFCRCKRRKGVAGRRGKEGEDEEAIRGRERQGLSTKGGKGEHCTHAHTNTHIHTHK